MSEQTPPAPTVEQVARKVLQDFFRHHPSAWSFLSPANHAELMQLVADAMTRRDHVLRRAVWQEAGDLTRNQAEHYRQAALADGPYDFTEAEVCEHLAAVFDTRAAAAP